MSVFQGARSHLPASAGAPILECPLNRRWDLLLPNIGFNATNLAQKLESGYPLMTQGKFPDAQLVFQAVLNQALLTVAQKREEVDNVFLLI